MNETFHGAVEAFEECLREKYLCTVQDYDDAADRWLITWTDANEESIGFWLTQDQLEQLFNEVILN